MQRFFKFLNKEVNGLHQAAFFLATASVGAKLLAILRDRLLASSFGAGKDLDIYYASFRLPDMLYVFSLFLVSVTALIPVFLEKRGISEKQSKDFINGVFTTFFAVMVILMIGAYFAVPYLTNIIAPGFLGEDINSLVTLSRILLFSPFLLGLSNLVAGVIQSFRRFFVYALSGVLYNVGIIFGLLFLFPKFGMVGVVWGVVVGAVMHLLIQVPSLIHLGYFPSFNKSFFEKKLRMEIIRIIKLSFPRTLGLTLNQLVLTAITAFASFLAVGSISVFNLASNLQAIPLGIIALSYSTAAFPSLASNFIKKEKDKFLSVVIYSFRHILFWLLPISVLFIVLRAQIVRVVLGAGAFTWTDTRLTAAALGLFAMSLFSQGLVLLLVRAFYAAGKTKLPLIINTISSSVIIFLSLVFLFLFKNLEGLQVFFRELLRVENVSGVSVLALPLAFSIGSVLNFLLLYVYFGREFSSISKYVKTGVFQMILTSIVAGLVAYFASMFLSCIFNLDTFLGIFGQGFLAGVLALVFGFYFLRFLKNKELEELVSSLTRKFSKSHVIKTEPEEIP
ncbi:MAG: lipid II flippase MurJ [Patescibacteria group bacterium]